MPPPCGEAVSIAHRAAPPWAWPRALHTLTPPQAQPIMHSLVPPLHAPTPKGPVDVPPGRRLFLQHALGVARAHDLPAGSDQPAPLVRWCCRRVLPPTFTRRRSTARVALLRLSRRRCASVYPWRHSSLSAGSTSMREPSRERSQSELRSLLRLQFRRTFPFWHR